MSFRCTKEYFVCRITQKVSDISWTMLGNSWKCIFNCVSWFVSIVVNFNALCDASLKVFINCVRCMI